MQINKVIREAKEYIAAHEQLKRYMEGHLIEKLCNEVERLEDENENIKLDLQLDEMRRAGL